MSQLHQQRRQIVDIQKQKLESPGDHLALLHLRRAHDPHAVVMLQAPGAPAQHVKDHVKKQELGEDADKVHKTDAVIHRR